MKMNVQTFEPFCDPNPENPKDWPYYQKYMGTCTFCNLTYSGPKHSHCCWECVSEEGQSKWLNSYKEKE